MGARPFAREAEAVQAGTWSQFNDSAGSLSLRREGYLNRTGVAGSPFRQRSCSLRWLAFAGIRLAISFEGETKHNARSPDEVTAHHPSLRGDRASQEEGPRIPRRPRLHRLR